MIKFTYKIKKRAKDKGDYRITKHGEMAEFSLRELNRNIEQVRKQAKEMEANARLQESLAVNIRRANPDLVAYMKKLSPKKRHALIMLSIQENKAKLYKQFGNSVTVTVIERVAQQVRKALEYKNVSRASTKRSGSVLRTTA